MFIYYYYFDDDDDDDDDALVRTHHNETGNNKTKFDRQRELNKKGICKFKFIRTREKKKKKKIYILKANVLFRRHENDVGRVRRAYDRVDFQHRVQRDVHHIFFRVCVIFF